MKEETANKLYNILLNKIEYFSFNNTYGGYFTNQEVKLLLTKGVCVSEDSKNWIYYIDNYHKKSENYSLWFYFNGVEKDCESKLLKRIKEINPNLK